MDLRKRWMAIVHRLAYRLSSPGSHHYTFLIRRFVKYLVVPNYKLVVSKNTSSVITAKWISFLIETLRIALGIPYAEFPELGKLFTEAETLLVKAQGQAEHTHVITVECRAAFKALSAKMRFFRDRYFKIPPLTEGDWAALGFRQKDTHPSSAPAPDRVPAAFLCSRYENQKGEAGQWGPVASVIIP